MEVWELEPNRSMGILPLVGKLFTPRGKGMSVPKLQAGTGAAWETFQKSMVFHALL